MRTFSKIRYPTPIEQSSGEDVSTKDIYRRLLRLSAEVTTVSVFPWIISPLEGKGARIARLTRWKAEDDRYTFTCSSFMSWDGWERGRFG